jgi:hypothetical protein
MQILQRAINYTGEHYPVIIDTAKRVNLFLCSKLKNQHQHPHTSLRA